MGRNVVSAAGLLPPLLLLLVVMMPAKPEIPVELRISPDTVMRAGKNATIICSANASREDLWGLQFDLERPGRTLRSLWVPDANVYLASTGSEPRRVGDSVLQLEGIRVDRRQSRNATELEMQLRADTDVNGSRVVCVAYAYRRYARQPEEEWRSEENKTLTVVRDGFNMTLQAAAGEKVLQENDGRVRLPDGSVRVEVRCRMGTEVPDSQLELRSGDGDVARRSCSLGLACSLSVNLSVACGANVSAKVRCTARSGRGGGLSHTRVLRLNRPRAVPDPSLSPANGSVLVPGDNVTCTTACSSCTVVRLRIVAAPVNSSAELWRTASGIGRATLSVPQLATGGQYEVQCEASNGAGTATAGGVFTVNASAEVWSCETCIAKSHEHHWIVCDANVPAVLELIDRPPCHTHGSSFLDMGLGHSSANLMIGHYFSGNCSVNCINNRTGLVIGYGTFDFRQVDDEYEKRETKVKVCKNLKPPSVPPPSRRPILVR